MCSLPIPQRRTVEDLKARYYSIWTKIAIAREELKRLHGTNKDARASEFSYRYDAEHEKKRKEQLVRLSKRTFAQIHEEVLLSSELKRIQQQKEDREGTGGASSSGHRSSRRASHSSADDGHRSKKHAPERGSRIGVISSSKAMSAIRPPPPHSTHLRSAVVHRQLALRPKQAQQVADVCTEMGIVEFPMPTKDVRFVSKSHSRSLGAHGCPIALFAD